MTNVLPPPGPRPLPVFGNAFEIDRKNVYRTYSKFAKQYGPIFRLVTPGFERVYLSSQALVDELCSRKDFVKMTAGPLAELRTVIPESVFTADHGQAGWDVYHRILLRAFSPSSVRNMFPDMLDVATQLVMKWARHGPDHPIDVIQDFTRLTTDTIALCAFDARFNSFYSDETHPFNAAFTRLLNESLYRALRPAFLKPFYRANSQQFEKDKAYVHAFLADVVVRRRAQKAAKKDLVDCMLHKADPVTGQTMADGAIEDNMATFLIAGQETTSGVLAFLFALLLMYPRAYAELQREVDAVLGGGPLTPDHLAKLPYTKACIRETLRLQPPIGGFVLRPEVNDATVSVVLGNQWAVPGNVGIMVLNTELHRDPAVWGDDADEFKPERMLEDKFRQLPRNAWKPWGNGRRQCVGREFAMQESILAVALLMQKFDFRPAEPDWTLSVEEIMTRKPVDLFMKATLRGGLDPVSLMGTMYPTFASHATVGGGPGGPSAPAE